VPGFFQEAGLAGIHTYMSDKVSLMLPPYETEEQQALAREYAAGAERGAAGTFHSAGGQILYLVSGRRPSS
jgi:hypothetical protein